MKMIKIKQMSFGSQLMNAFLSLFWLSQTGAGQSGLSLASPERMK